MLRRQFLTGLTSAAFVLNAKPRISRGRISVITDEVAATPEDAIAFVNQYGLRLVELRSVPGGGGHYMRQSGETLREQVRIFRENGIKVSFLNTPMFKITLPGTEPLAKKRMTPEAWAGRLADHQAQFDRRKQDFEQAFRAAHILEIDKIRVFTFLRTADPTAVFQQSADVIGEMAELASKQGIKLLVENENACNVVSCAEVAAFLKLLPEKTVGLNWDPWNGLGQNEPPYPDGYKLVPVKRLWNVQMKGESLLNSERKLDWAAIFGALNRDGYNGAFGLETHTGKTRIEQSHASMREIFRVLES
jgi:L-ribulose-5-phosphate 3-epimerase